jgi:hypothetical protein
MGSGGDGAAYPCSRPSCSSPPREAPQLAPPEADRPPEPASEAGSSSVGWLDGVGSGGGTPTGFLPMCRLRRWLRVGLSGGVLLTLVPPFP